jgi:hypothetical protein
MGLYMPDPLLEVLSLTVPLQLLARKSTLETFVFHDYIIQTKPFE